MFASGDALESEIWADANVVAETYERGSSRNSVTVRLADPKASRAFKAALEANPQLKIDASTTLDYFSKQSEGMAKVIRIIGIVVGAIMAIGAMFGALNTMFAAVAARAREIATLRAIGFAGLPVVVAIMLETMLLALAGGVIGGALAWLLFNGYAASTMAAGSVGKLSFELHVTRGRAVAGPEVGAGDRLHRRPVPGRARGDDAGDGRVARALRRASQPAADARPTVSTGRSGSTRWNTLPSPIVLVTPTLPPCASTRRLVSARLRPAPS